MPDSFQVQNPLDTSEYFVRQHYLDFLGREPDEGGFNYWSSQFDACNGDAACLDSLRLGISAAFFIEQEFQQTGSFIYRLYKAGLGRQLSYTEFSADRPQVIGGVNLDRSKIAFADAFVQRPEFVQAYQNKSTAESFVDTLLAQVWNASAIDPGRERSHLIAIYKSGGNINQSRSLALQWVIDNSALKQTEYNKSFVLMQYFGYLKRDADQGGFDFWLNVLNNREPDSYRGMVCSFITSAEYQMRFASVVSHSNDECR
ncbi:MAG: DUF4214 domain-containing protein [Pyrinomonadaceae bacterium]